MNEPYLSLLRLLKPDLWYCPADYDGCELLEPGTPVKGKAFSQLIEDGYVESVPVFDGFTMMKYRITDSGLACLAES